jgi:hypothetical protein
MKLRSIATAVVFVLLSLSAFAWNCTQPGQVRVQVPTGTVGNGIGDGPGQVVVDNGLTFQCQTLPPATPPTTPTTATSTSSSGATSGSTSGASATGGNSKSTSGVSNSGNSTNTLSNQQTQNQTQSNTSSNKNDNAASASNSGNNSAYNNSETTNIKPESASAITPTLIPTAPCLGTIGGAGQTIAGGLSFGATKVDKGCDSRQAALLFAVSLHNSDAAARIMCATRAAKSAKLTLAQCLASFVPVPVQVIAPAPAPVAVTPIAVTVNIPEPQPKLIYLEMPHETVTVTAPLGSFKPAKHPVKRPTTHGKPCNVPKSLTQPLEK